MFTVICRETFGNYLVANSTRTDARRNNEVFPDRTPVMPSSLLQLPGDLAQGLTRWISSSSKLTELFQQSERRKPAALKNKEATHCYPTSSRVGRVKTPGGVRGRISITASSKTSNAASHRCEEISKWQYPGSPAPHSWPSPAWAQKRIPKTRPSLPDCYRVPRAPQLKTPSPPHRKSSR